MSIIFKFELSLSLSLSLSLALFSYPTTFHIVSEVQIHLMATERNLGKFTVFQIGLEFYLTKRNLNSFIAFEAHYFLVDVLTLSG